MQVDFADECGNALNSSMKCIRFDVCKRGLGDA